MTWIALPALLLLVAQQDQIVIADTRIEQAQTPPQPVTTPTLDEPDPETAAKERPIIVERDRDEEPDRVILGSRIPRGSFYTNGNVATSTGIGGLAPGAGLEPFAGTNRVSKRITSTCVSDNDAVSERGACLLLEAESAIAEYDMTAAADIYRYLLGSDDFSATERLEGGRGLFAIATATDDTVLREEALIRLVESGLLDETQQASARRNLVSLALQRGDIDLGFARLEQHVTLAPDDAQSLANLAIMRRTHGRDGAVSTMQQAIAAREAEGGAVPQGWRDLAAGLPLPPEAAEVSSQP